MKFLDNIKALLEQRSMKQAKVRADVIRNRNKPANTIVNNSNVWNTQFISERKGVA